MNTQEKEQQQGRRFLVDRGYQIITAVCSIIGTACLIGGLNFASKVYRSWDAMEGRITNMEAAVSAIQTTGNNTAADVKVIKAEQANTKDDIKELKQYSRKE